MTSRAMVLERLGEPLVMRARATPAPQPGELAIAIEACAVCRTDMEGAPEEPPARSPRIDLHILDGELADGGLPRVLGHQIVGTVTRLGGGVTAFGVGDRVGVPWLGSTCGGCHYCRGGRENLCRAARFTGYHRDGGFAEACVADARYAFAIPPGYAPADAAPLLCGALIGYRALRLAGDATRLGVYGFGSAGHLIAQIARHQGREVFAFTRAGDARGQAFARDLGAVWAGGSDDRAPVELDAAIVFAPAGELVPRALAAVAPGGTVVCAGIHMTDIPSFPYRLLWEERTRRDAEELLGLAPVVGLRPKVTTYALDDANAALADLRAGRFDGTAVLVTR